MLRIERIEQALKSYPDGISAGDLAQALNLSRANVSSDLNRLCQQGYAEKSDGRPVRYLTVKQAPASDSASHFDAFLQKNPSLFHCGEQAKAAVLYPPHGMHMLLFGETGVGKSMFAEKIYQFAKSQGCIQADGAFVIFNCADYANNPQLLLTQLFGAVKGAYTGAERDRAGLLEEADGGILLLDEVHRLPVEGQEMLFSYMDRRSFRRLGEAADERSADIILICATTEKPASALLSTFMRRIPMMIQLPNLESRGLEERFNLIRSFFEEEARKLHAPIQVSLNSIRALLSYPCTANIGQLKSDVQLLCAHAYSGYIAERRDSIAVTSSSLPAYIRHGLLDAQDRNDVWQLLSGINQRFLTFQPTSTTDIQEREANDVYELVERQIADMKRFGMSDDAIYQEIGELLRKYYLQSIPKTELYESIENLENYVGTRVMETGGKIISLAKTRLQKIVTENVQHGIILHLFNALKRIRNGQTIVNPRLASIQEHFPEIYALALDCLQIIEDDFRIVFPPDEAGFLSLIFLSITNTQEQSYVQIILIMHGEHTASSMATAANRLTGTDAVHGFDMQLDEKPETVYQRLRAYLKQCSHFEEVLLLVDMGSLSDFAYQIEQEFDARAKSLVLVSTLHAMEAARKASMGYSLSEVYDATLRVNELAPPPAQTVADHAAPLYIITACTTGEGSAKVISDKLKALDLKDGLVEIVPSQVTNQKRFRQQIEVLEQKGKIIAVISTFTTSLRVRHFPITTVFEEKGLRAVQDLIDQEVMFNKVAIELVANLECAHRESLSSDVRAIIERIAANMDKRLTTEMLIGAFCHVCCMLDRLLLGEPTSRYPDREALTEKHPQVKEIVARHCKRLGDEYHVVIPEDEICYLTAFFTQEAVI